MIRIPIRMLRTKIVHFLVKILDVFLKIHIYGNKKLHKNLYYEGLLLTHHKINISTKLQSSIDETKLKIKYLPSNWRILIYNFFANEASGLGGAYVELGVGKGSMSLITIPTTMQKFRDYWLIDKFDPFMVNAKTGLSLKKKMEGIYANSSSEVKQNFSHLDGVNLIQGSLPEILNDLLLPPIAFLHIDLNAAEPEVKSLKKLWPLLLPHGIVLLDDYCWAGRNEQYEAMNKLAEELKFDILSLPTGQGLIIK